MQHTMLISWKIILLFWVSAAGALEQCDETRSQMPAPSAEVDRITVGVHYYPVQTYHQYGLKKDRITVRLKQKRVDLDSVLYDKALKPGFFSGLASAMGEYDKDRYYNECIQDGQLLVLQFENKDSVFKKVTFGNYYDVYVDKIIQFINKQVDPEYRISYDRDKLIRGMMDCR